MASIALSNASKTARAQALLDLIETTGAATLYLYADQQPVNPDTPIDAQVQLAAMPCPDPFGTVTDGVLTGNSFQQHLTTEGTGTATWGRLVNQAGDTIGDFTVGLQGSGANIEMLSTQFYPGVLVLVSSFVVTEV